jgi:hypothetical protein
LPAADDRRVAAPDSAAAGASATVDDYIRFGICTERCPFGVDAVHRMKVMQTARGGVHR